MTSERRGSPRREAKIRKRERAERAAQRAERGFVPPPPKPPVRELLLTAVDLSSDGTQARIELAVDGERHRLELLVMDYGFVSAGDDQGSEFVFDLGQRGHPFAMKRALLVLIERQCGELVRMPVDLGAKRLRIEVLGPAEHRGRAIAERWLSGDLAVCRLLESEAEPAAMAQAAVEWLAFCCQLVDAPAAVLEVVRAGSDRSSWCRGHEAFDAVRQRTLAAQRGGVRTDDPRYRLLLVAEMAAEVVYNATSPRDPFDRVAGARFLRELSELARLLPGEHRAELVERVRARWVEVHDAWRARPLP